MVYWFFVLLYLLALGFGMLVSADMLGLDMLGLDLLGKLAGLKLDYLVHTGVFLPWMFLAALLVRSFWGLALCFVLGLGVVWALEWGQIFVESRVYDRGDLLAGLVGMGLSLLLFLCWQAFVALFSRCSLQRAGFFESFVDVHSHFLPSVDDGMETFERAYELLDVYEAMGIKAVVLTPHVMELYGDNDAVFLRERFDAFVARYKGGLRLRLAAEYMLDASFERHLESGDLLSFGDSHLLIEACCVEEPVLFHSRLEEVMRRGYFVVLAHPERYWYMSRSDYRCLREMGLRFQLNLLSLSGFYGRRARVNAFYLLSQGMYDFIGSDLHDGAAIEAMCRMRVSRKVLRELRVLIARSNTTVREISLDEV